MGWDGSVYSRAWAEKSQWAWIRLLGRRTLHASPFDLEEALSAYNTVVELVRRATKAERSSEEDGKLICFMNIT